MASPRRKAAHEAARLFSIDRATVDHCVRLPLLKAGVAERSGATEGLSSGSRLDADRGQCVAPIRTSGPVAPARDHESGGDLLLRRLSCGRQVNERTRAGGGDRRGKGRWFACACLPRPYLPESPCRGLLGLLGNPHNRRTDQVRHHQDACLRSAATVE